MYQTCTSCDHMTEILLYCVAAGHPLKIFRGTCISLMKTAHRCPVCYVASTAHCSVQGALTQTTSEYAHTELCSYGTFHVQFCLDDLSRDSWNFTLRTPKNFFSLIIFCAACCTVYFFYFSQQFFATVLDKLTYPIHGIANGCIVVVSRWWSVPFPDPLLVLAAAPLSCYKLISKCVSASVHTKHFCGSALACSKVTCCCWGLPSCLSDDGMNGNSTGTKIGKLSWLWSPFGFHRC